MCQHLGGDDSSRYRDGQGRCRQAAELLPSAQSRVNLAAVNELGFLLYHEAEKKDTKDAILFMAW